VSERLVGFALGKERGTRRDRVRAAVQSEVACGRALGRGRYIQSAAMDRTQGRPFSSLHAGIFSACQIKRRETVPPACGNRASATPFAFEQDTTCEGERLALSPI
jgi:hypothetical protein